LLPILFWPYRLQAQESPKTPLTRAEPDWLAAHPRVLLGSDAHWRPWVWAGKTLPRPASRLISSCADRPACRGAS